MGSLAVAAALRANPVGATAWGCGLILAGGALFLSSEQNKWLTRALLIGAWGVSALPFSLTATGWNSGFVPPLLGWLAWPFLIAAHAMLVAGFVRHSLRIATRVSSEDQPIWAKNVYPIGISLLLLVTILLGLFGWDGTMQFGNWFVADPHFPSDHRLDLADPASSHPQPGPRPLGASREHLLARMGLSGLVESLPAAGTDEQRDLKRAGRRKWGHVDVIVPCAFRFLFAQGIPEPWK